MIKYELREDTFSVKKSLVTSLGDIFQAYHETDDNNPVTIQVFDDSQEALDALSDYNCTAYECSSPIGTMLRGDLYYIEIGEFDEDGDFIRSNAFVFAEFDDFSLSKIYGDDLDVED